MRRRPRPSRRLLVAGALLLQVVLLLIVVAPRLSARLAGAEYRLAVGPVDPIDPFRGAYVSLTYPGLPPGTGQWPGQVFVPLVPDGALWKGGDIVLERPAAPPYLACESRGYGALSCGIDSLFLPQDRARAAEVELVGGRAAAVVSVDDRGNAALIEIVSG